MPFAPGVGPCTLRGLAGIKNPRVHSRSSAAEGKALPFWCQPYNARMNQKRPAASEWVSKMLAVLKSGNTTAAIAQIKATTSSKDLRQLHATLEKAQLFKQLPGVETAISDQLQALASPRLSRSP